MWLLDGIANVPASEARVVDLTLDSRQVREGSLFFALPGLNAHGLKFAADAAARGASVVLWEPRGDVVPPALPASVFAAAIPNLKNLVGRIADRFFNWPSAHLRIAAITGTNGKTTCAYLLAQCLERLGLAAAYMGTIGWGRPATLAEPTHTTPDAVTVHRTLAQLRASGVREVAMEVSSHALDQGRVDGVRFQIAAFTNLTRDHLDYHGTMHEYGAAKAKLFQVADLKHIVLNVGDEFGRALARDYAGNASLIAVWVGAGDSGWLADRALHATQVRLDPHGISMELDGSFGKLTVKTQLLGRFNAENSLVVIACLLSLGVSLPDAANALAECKPAPGRMEVGRCPQQADRRGRLRPYARCAVEGFECGTRALRGSAVVRIRLRRGPRFRQAPRHGRDRRRFGRSNHRHRRQSAFRGSAGHHGRHRQRHQITCGAGHSRSR